MSYNKYVLTNDEIIKLFRESKFASFLKFLNAHPEVFKLKNCEDEKDK